MATTSAHVSSADSIHVDTEDTQVAAARSRLAEYLLRTGIAISLYAAAAPVLGYHGLGLFNRIPGALNHGLNIDAPIPGAATIDLGGALAWVESTNGTVDAATGLPAVSFGGPATGTLSVLDPSTAERWAYVGLHAAWPLLIAAGLWTLLQVVGSAREEGSPFTERNGRRLWRLASIVAVGGTILMTLGSLFETWIIENSAAASLFDQSVTLSFMPLLIGSAIATVAWVWSNGVNRLAA